VGFEIQGLVEAYLDLEEGQRYKNRKKILKADGLIQKYANLSAQYWRGIRNIAAAYGVELPENTP